MLRRKNIRMIITTTRYCYREIKFSGGDRSLESEIPSNSAITPIGFRPRRRERSASKVVPSVLPVSASCSVIDAITFLSLQNCLPCKIQTQPQVLLPGQSNSVLELIATGLIYGQIIERPRLLFNVSRNLLSSSIHGRGK